MARQPDFIGIGVQKAGTSWLAACLNEHPQIRIPIKETGFFTDWFGNLDRYEEKLGQGTMPWEKVGEFSTKYFHTPGIAGMVKKAYPFVKILVVLRHPIDRVESIWRHQRMRGRTIDLDQAIEWSKYADRLEEWFKEFPEMKVVVYEKLVGNPDYWIRMLYRWLGVDSTFKPKILRKRVNRSIEVRSVEVARLLDRLGRLRYKRGFRWVWWKGWAVGLRDWVKRWNGHGESEKFNYFERGILWGEFRQDVERVESMVGKTWWRG